MEIDSFGLFINRVEVVLNGCLLHVQKERVSGLGSCYMFFHEISTLLFSDTKGKGKYFISSFQ